MKCDEIFAALAMLEKERGISQTFMMDKIVQALTTATSATTRAWKTSWSMWTRASASSRCSCRRKSWMRSRTPARR